MSEVANFDPIIDVGTVCKASGNIHRRTLFEMRKRGFYPSPIRFTLGGRRLGWFLSEIQAINAARGRGASETELKKLAADLEAKRKGNQQ